MINKLIKYIKKEGIIRTAKKGFKVTKRILFFSNSRVNKKIINQTIDINKFDTIIIFENNFGWNKIMRQRPQQIASNLPANTLMFYHSHENEDYKQKNHITKLKDNLVLIDLGYFRNELIDILSPHNNKYLMIYSTDYIPEDRVEKYQKKGFKIIYEYVDEINENLCGKDMYKILKQRHINILKKNPITICTAEKLYNEIKKINPNNCILISNGVDYNHFENQEYEIPEDLKEIKNKHKYLLCYYGALASWFDYELVKDISKEKEIGIILIGQDYDKTLKESKILCEENIYYLGKKDYEDLPKYGCNIDIFLIPFKLNDITESTSPVKLFEYMAMQKPIVTTNLPECKKYESALCSKNKEEFIKNIHIAITKRKNLKYINVLKKEAKENDWKGKSLKLVNFVNAKTYNNIQAEIEKIISEEEYDRIIIWRSPFGWNVPLFQRPQHIANQLSKNKCLVFYEVTSKTDNVNFIEKKQKNLYLINFENNGSVTMLENQLEKITKPKYIQIYSTNWSMSLKDLKNYQKNNYRVIYEYIDDINPALAGTDKIPKYIIDKYNYALKDESILIVTTANELYKIVKNKRGKKNLVMSSNGVDFNFFQNIDNNYKFEQEFKETINNGKINICYYGALAIWFDYELIKKINNTNKYNVILFGVKYDDSFDKSNINKLKNVYFFGSKDYSILKNYANKMDILIIPFIINSITKATSPLKLFEYMALHKPIVTTAMDECKKYKSVLIANNHNEFLDKLKKCKKLAQDEKYIKILNNEARENDWSEKAAKIIELMKEGE